MRFFMSLSTGTQTIFYSQSMSKHLKSLSCDSDSTNSGFDSYIAVSPKHSRTQSFQEEEVAVQLSKIPIFQKDIPNEPNVLLDRKMEDQTLNKEPPQLTVESLYQMLIEQEKQRRQEQEKRRQEQEKQRQEQELINRQLILENQDLKKKSNYIEQDLLQELEIMSQELEKTKRELLTYKNKV